MPRLDPVEILDHCECSAAPSARRAQCGVCGKTFAGGSIVNAHAIYDHAEDTYTVLSQVYCDHCEHIMSWIEAVRLLDDQAIYTGLVMSGPGYIRSRARIRAFLHQHPEATGVLQR
jgi:hypothetical protein